MQRHWTIDCDNCGRRIGWAGKYRDRPPCAKCGFELSPSAMARVSATLDDIAPVSEPVTFSKEPDDDEA